MSRTPSMREFLPIRLGRRQRGLLLLGTLLLAACATHRGDPPQCKGPFTPINAPATGVSHGS